MTKKYRNQPRSRDIIGLLDIGSSKTVCVIATIDPNVAAGSLSGVRIIGIAEQPSQGITSGVVTDIDAAEDTLVGVVSLAEDMAGVRLDRIVVSVSCGRLSSRTFRAHADVPGGVVGDGEIRRVLAGARAYAERDGETLVHLNKIGFSIDDAPCGEDPRGMAARLVSGELHALMVAKAPLRNLTKAVDQSILGVSALVAQPYASALAATSVEERELGVTCVDIGGGTASVAVFAEGKLLSASVASIGSDNLTRDIARSLQTPLAQAERIKTLYGTMVYAHSDEHEDFAYPLADGVGGLEERMTKAQLSRLIRPRVSEIITSVQECVEQSRLAGCGGERIVLTGGGSQLVGLADYAANAFCRPVRIGCPVRVSGLPQSFSGPAFSTVVGLLIAAVAPSRDVVRHAEVSSTEQRYLGRVGQWLMDGL